MNNQENDDMEIAYISKNFMLLALEANFIA